MGGGDGERGFTSRSKIKSNQINFIGIKSSHRTCIQLHKNNHRHNTSTNLVIDETMKYEKYGN